MLVYWDSSENFWPGTAGKIWNARARQRKDTTMASERLRLAYDAMNKYQGDIGPRSSVWNTNTVVLLEAIEAEHPELTRPLPKFKQNEVVYVASANHFGGAFAKIAEYVWSETIQQYDYRFHGVFVQGQWPESLLRKLDASERA